MILLWQLLKTLLTILLFALVSNVCTKSALSQDTSFHVLAFYSTDVEQDHVLFAKQAIEFFNVAAAKDHFAFEATTRWDDLNAETLRKYQVVLWLNEFPHTEEQRAAFEHYMENGGGWLGFHVSAFNDEGTHWPWFVGFLGCGVFYGNSWPPLPAQLLVDDRSHPVTRHLPAHFLAPANEWYSWKPDPRANLDIKVLLTLDPANYPLGLKDTLTGGDVPVVWTNRKYRMLYVNMGHGAHIFDDKNQNFIFEDGLLWLGNRKQVSESDQ